MGNAMRKAAPLALAAGMALAGCAGVPLLPHSSAVVKHSWGSFEEARDVVVGFRPNHTTVADLHAAGLDPYVNPNVELLNHSDILRRFPHAGSLQRLDDGLRECLEAGKACVGYAIDLRHSAKERVGPVLLDLMGFRREVVTTGWTFNAIVLVVREHMVYALYGGRPAISETEKSVEPLGPFQNWNGSGLIR